MHHALSHRRVKKTTDDDKTPQPFDTTHNKLYRSYVDQGDITHVDPFTGNMSIHLPLIDVPSNDGLSLKVTMSFNNNLPPAKRTLIC